MSHRLPHICFVALQAYPVLAGDTDIELVGGAEVQQVIVAKGLVERGYRVSMICMDHGQKDQCEIQGITVYRAFRPNAGVPVVRFIWPRLTSIWNCLRRADADIYYQRAAGMTTGLVAEFCRRAGKRSIFAAAGNPDLEPDTPRIRLWRDRKLYEYGLRHVDRILVQNEEQARLCRLNLGREPILLPNCFPAPKSSRTDCAGHVLWVSTLRALKRPELFLDLAAAFPQRTFRMIGGPSGSEGALFDSIRDRAKSLSNLEFFGFVPYAAIDEHFDNAAIFVNTSESEGFPNAFLQAWARGVPTVSFVDAGARMNGHVIGRVVASLQEMADAVAELLSDSKAHAEQSLRAAAYFKSHHSPEMILDLYEQVLGELNGQDT